MQQHTITLNLICTRGNVTRVTLESNASGPVSVTLGKNTAVPVLRSEGQFSRQRAEWQMSDGHGSDYASIRCGTQVALLSWINGRFIQRSGSLPLEIAISPGEEQECTRTLTRSKTCSRW